jgi:hypothetical protein
MILDGSGDEDEVGSEEEESDEISSTTRRLLRVARFVAGEGLSRSRGSLKEESYAYSKYYESNVIVFVLVLTLELIRTCVVERWALRLTE